MGNYLINHVKYGVVGGSMACGPGNGVINVSVHVTEEDGKSFWLSNAEVDCLPNFYLSEEDIFEQLMGLEENEDFIEFTNQKYIHEFGDIAVDYYEEIFNTIEEMDYTPVVALLRYIILLSRCDMDEVDDLIKMATGKYVDTLDIPMSDLEEELFVE